MPEFVNVDFRFKRGTRDGVNHTPIQNGSLIVTTDTQEFFVDIDDQRLVISGVEFYPTENDIKSIEVPGDKLYVAFNTRRILTYNRTTSEWIYVSGGGIAIGECLSESNEQNKIVTLEGDFVLEEGALLAIKFANTNEYEVTEGNSITLNVNNTGAYDIYYKDTNNHLGADPIAYGFANAINQYMFDGEYWVWMGTSYDTDTTYEPMTVNELVTGTETELRTVRADYLNEGVNDLIDSKINELDVSGVIGLQANQTIKDWSETDGKVNIVSQNIEITKSQVSDFPTELADFNSDATHRLVTDEDIDKWNNTASTSLVLGETENDAYRGDRGKTAYDHSQVTSGNPHGVLFADLTDKPTVGEGVLTIQKNGNSVATFNANSTTNATANITVPTALSELSADATHRLVTDTEKTTWNGKQNALTAGTNITISGTTISAKDTTYGTTSTSAAGLCPKLNGSTSNYLRGDGQWVTPPDHTYTVNNGTLYVQKNGSNVGTFTANQSGNTTANITVPTKTSELTNDSSFITSDTRVYQENTATASADYRVLFSYNVNNNNENSYSRKTERFTFNPSNGYLHIGDSFGGLQHSGNQQLWFIASGEADYKLFLGVMNDGGNKWMLCPGKDNYLKLGGPSHRWNQVYAANGNIDTSDRKQKKDITDLNLDQIKKFLMDIKPVSYKMKDGTSGRTHYGFIAQDIEETLDKLGMTPLDFAGFCKDQKVEDYTDIEINEDGDEVEVHKTRNIEGEFVYGLRYDEFISPMLKLIQDQENRIESLESEVKELKDLVNKLLNNMGGINHA